jgi:Holliday junction resolvase RusA-like endonuclease
MGRSDLDVWYDGAGRPLRVGVTWPWGLIGFNELYGTNRQTGQWFLKPAARSWKEARRLEFARLGLEPDGEHAWDVSAFLMFAGRPPDIDHPTKALLDTFTGLVYKDDKQVPAIPRFERIRTHGNPCYEIVVTRLERLETEAAWRTLDGPRVRHPYGLGETSIDAGPELPEKQSPPGEEGEGRESERPGQATPQAACYPPPGVKAGGSRRTRQLLPGLDEVGL